MIYSKTCRQGLSDNASYRNNVSQSRSYSMPKPIAATSGDHIHPRPMLQRVQLSDGSQIEWTSFSGGGTTRTNGKLVTFALDSGNHPSWNPLSKSSKAWINEQGSVSKFNAKFGESSDIFSTSESKQKASCGLEVSSIDDILNISGKLPEKEKKLSSIEKLALDGPPTPAAGKKGGADGKAVKKKK